MINRITSIETAVQQGRAVGKTNRETGELGEATGQDFQ
jgi:hypothetical protein